MTDVVLPPLPARAVDAFKGDCGRTLVIAGSTGMMGAGCLAARAALRGGAGVVYWAVPKRHTALAQSLLVEAIAVPVPETDDGSPSVDAREYLLEAAREADAVVIGPGLPATGETGELIRLLVPEIFAPLVVDAGALSAIGAEWAVIRKRTAPTIVTPHPGEMARLVNQPVEDVQARREHFAARYAQAAKTVVALKGAGTVVADGQRSAVNATGNPGMATAGAGDVLAGLVAALVAQGMEPYDAARLGVHLHGLAGDLATEALGVHGVVAGDLVEFLPRAFMRYAALDDAAGSAP